MSRTHVSGSSVDRFMQCQHWAHPSIALPKTVPNEAMKEGTRRHKIAEFILRGGKHFPEPRDFELVKTATMLRDLTSILQVEQGYAYDPSKKTARLIVGRTDEGYAEASGSEIPCTVDAVYRDADGVLVVRDWKLGATGAGYYQSPHTSGQLLLAMQALRVSGVFTADVMAVEFADDQNVYRAPVTHALLDQFADDLAFAWTSVTDTTQPGAPVPGPKCKWCPLEKTCPAPFGIVTQSTASITDGKFRLPQAIESSRDANDFIAASEFVEAYLERMKEQLKEFARSNVVLKGKQQYREEPEARTVTQDLGPLGCYSLPEALPDDTEIRVVAKYKGEPKPVFRWRSMVRK